MAIQIKTPAFHLQTCMPHVINRKLPKIVSIMFNPCSIQRKTDLYVPLLTDGILKQFEPGSRLFIMAMEAPVDARQ